MSEISCHTGPVDVDVLVCTYQRASISRTLRSLDAQKRPKDLALRVIVADNDETPSAAEIVAAVSETISIPVVYLHAPARNISIARNACLERADATWIAFIDDDEWAAPDWIESLLAAVRSGANDGVFGPVIASYDSDAPAWIRDGDYLSTWPTSRSGETQTGYTGNALLRWNGGPFRQLRFRLDKGRTGGEDTEFFFGVWRAGGRFAIADQAFVYETVEKSRLHFDWIKKRKFRAGQSYGRHFVETSTVSAISQFTGAAAKIISCATMTTLTAFSAERRRYWFLRGVFHCGVLAASLGSKEAVFYGE